MDAIPAVPAPAHVISLQLQSCKRLLAPLSFGSIRHIVMQMQPAANIRFQGCKGCFPTPLAGGQQPQADAICQALESSMNSKTLNLAFICTKVSSDSVTSDTLAWSRFSAHSCMDALLMVGTRVPK